VLPPGHKKKGQDITFDEIEVLFHLPIKAAANELGICLSLLKKLCRKYSVHRWPQRYVDSWHCQCPFTLTALSHSHTSLSLPGNLPRRPAS
jgi:hypothetical protein